jgi:hypothetical protein
MRTAILSLLALLVTSTLGCSLEATNDDDEHTDSNEDALEGASAQRKAGYRVKGFGEDGLLRETRPANLSSTLPASSLGDGTGGRFVVADATGQDGRRRPVVEHRLASGALDTSFGNRGTTSIQWPESTREDVGLLADSNGAILIVQKYAGGHSRLARLKRDGSPDLSFGDAGYFAHWFGAYRDNGDSLITVVMPPSGGYLLVGKQVDNGGKISCWQRTYFARVDRSGRIMRSWEGDGLAIQKFTKSDEPTGARIVDGNKVEIQVQNVGRTSSSKCWGRNTSSTNTSHLARIWL